MMGGLWITWVRKNVLEKTHISSPSGSDNKDNSIFLFCLFCFFTRASTVSPQLSRWNHLILNITPSAGRVSLPSSFHKVVS
jgi:hypothetical protein